MDNFLGFWLGTIALSVEIDFSTDLKMLKDVYDAGYKIKTENLDRYNNLSVPDGEQDTSNFNLLTIIVPIINILEMSRQRFEYDKNKEDFINMLELSGALEVMSPLEKEIYDKHPNVLSALFLNTKVAIRLNKANVIEIRTDKENGDIYYEVGNDFSDIRILKATGDMKKLSNNAQIEKVKSTIYNLVEDCVLKFMKEIGYTNETKDEEFLQYAKKEFMDYALEELNKENNIKVKKRTRR